MKLASSSQMRSIDKEAIESFGIPGVVLMENAGIKVFNHIMNFTESGQNVCIVCGRGNNGGDGFAAARHLYSSDRNVSLYMVGGEEGLKGDALVNYNIIKKLGIPIEYINDTSQLSHLAEGVKKCHLLVDGLLGTGIKGDVKPLYRDAIDIINKYAPSVISIDIPSGIDADTGKVLGAAVRARRTVTFQLPKVGLYMYPGAEYAGEVIIEDISIPDKVIENHAININLLTGSDIVGVFPQRMEDTNKGTYGRAYIIAGSENMMGAALMCTLGALRSGSGLVEVGVPACIQKEVASQVMEAIVNPLPQEDGKISPQAIEEVLRALERSSSFAIGPGLSKSPGLLRLLERVVTEAKIPGVIDADGLNLLCGNTEILRSAGASLIVTPHPGEMARLLGSDVKSVQEDRIGCARDFSREYGVVTLLKGANTVISSPSGEVFINTTGNPGMARGGSGDVLTGIIVSLLAQGIPPFESARAGAYIHGLAGDIARRALGEYGMKVSDIIENIPLAILEVQAGL